MWCITWPQICHVFADTSTQLTFSRSVWSARHPPPAAAGGSSCPAVWRAGGDGHRAGVNAKTRAASTGERAPFRWPAGGVQHPVGAAQQMWMGACSRGHRGGGCATTSGSRAGASNWSILDSSERRSVRAVPFCDLVGQTFPNKVRVLHMCARRGTARGPLAASAPNLPRWWWRVSTVLSCTVCAAGVTLNPHHPVHTPDCSFCGG